MTMTYVMAIFGALFGMFASLFGIFVEKFALNLGFIVAVALSTLLLALYNLDQFIALWNRSQRHQFGNGAKSISYRRYAFSDFFRGYRVFILSVCDLAGVVHDSALNLLHGGTRMLQAKRRYLPFLVIIASACIFTQWLMPVVSNTYFALDYTAWS